MKNSLWIVVVFFSLCSFELRAQSSSVSLYHVVSSYNVTCKTNKAIIRFYNQDIIDQFEKERMEEWFTSLSDEQKKKYEESVAWLKAGNSIAFSEQETSGKYAAELYDLIKNVMGSDLIKKGKAHVSNLTSQVQSSVRYLETNKLPNWKTYDFYFISDTSPFFSGQSKEPIKEEMKTMEVGVEESVVEIVFEEPVQEIVTQDDENRIFMIVEESPTYPGGMTKLQEYMAKNLKYPKSALKSGIEGSVYVSFVVEKDGALSNIMVIKGVEENCDKEAVRLIRESGKWTPGKQRGKVQRVKFVLPVKFRMPEKK